MTGPNDVRGLPRSYPFKQELELSVLEAKLLLERRTDELTVVDVRTSAELDVARIDGAVHIPLHELELRIDEITELPGPVAFLCHHGVRSMKAALLARAHGVDGARSIAGGIEAWSLAADPRVPRYERDGPICRVVV